MAAGVIIQVSVSLREKQVLTAHAKRLRRRSLSSWGRDALLSAYAAEGNVKIGPPERTEEKTALGPPVEGSPYRLGVIRRVNHTLELLGSGEWIEQSDLARALGVTTRTVRRLIYALAEVHPIKQSRNGRTVGYRLERKP